MSEGAFIRELDRERKAAARDALVGAYVWANRQTYGANDDLNRRAEAWADAIEKAGGTAEVLEALARPGTSPRPVLDDWPQAGDTCRWGCKEGTYVATVIPAEDEDDEDIPILECDACRATCDPPETTRKA